MAYVPNYTPTKYGSTSNGQYYVQTSPNGGQWSPIPRTPISGAVLGAGTQPPLPSGGGGGGGGGTTNTNTSAPSIDPVALAEMKRRSDFEAAKASADNMRTQGQNTFNDLITAVNAFRDRNNQSYTDAGQAITNNASDMYGTNASTAQDLVGKSTGRARALGLGLSSRINLGNDLMRNLESTQGNVTARTGEQNANNLALLNTRNDQADTNQNTANTYLKGINDQATTLQNTGTDNAAYDFGGALNNIIQYQRQLAYLQPMSANSITPYAPNFSGITNTLNSVLPTAGGTNTAGDTAINAFNDPAYIRKLIYGQ